jgi:hypothetical protein
MDRFLGIPHPSAARRHRKQASYPLPLDLHVLGLPPAFNLSHDQTLQFKSFTSIKMGRFVKPTKNWLSKLISITNVINSSLAEFLLAKSLNKRPHALLDLYF